MINTGCGYDAWTGAVRRVVTDLDVPGAVNSHGLKAMRTYTSSTGIGWSLSWQWQIYGRPYTNGASYLVNFPDGRAVTFFPPSISGETAYRAGRGTKERLFRNNPGGSDRSADLYLEDGSHVHFSWTVDNNDQNIVDEFTEQTFTDPYNRVTTLTVTPYIIDGRTSKHLTKVTDPSGRSLTYNYDAASPGRLASIVASTGQSATYTGFLDSLPSVSYSDGTSATYTYVEADYNLPHVGVQTPFKLGTAQDVRAEGPMQSIKYVYPSLAKIQGQVSEEQHISGVPRVSQFLPTNGIGSPSATNVEVRGDGPQRSFFIEKSGNSQNGNTPLLKTKTDFKAVDEKYDYDGNNYLMKITDRNLHETSFSNEAILGRPLTVTHPGGTFTTGTGFDMSTRLYTYSDSANPYYVHTVTDDNGNMTTYQRDGTTHQITEIDYPAGGGTETFVYNQFGEVTRHKRQNDYYEFADYDTTGLLTVLWNLVPSSTHPSTGPRTTFSYYPSTHAWRARVKTVTDARGFHTTYEYDKIFDANGNQTSTPCSGRGLITKISYPDDTHGETIAGGTSISFVYDIYGNLLSETQDQLGETTSYTYDEYKRLKTVTLPNTDAIPNQLPTIYDYTPSGYSAFSHTTNSVTSETSPSSIVTGRTFDENFRLSSETAGSQDSSVAATTFYGYDAVGNQTVMTDPRGSGLGDVNYTTSTEYDTRNRKMKVSPPSVPVYGVENTQWEYDRNGNVTRIVRADATEETKTYDTMNRVKMDTPPKDPGAPPVTTLFDYYNAGTLKTVTDAKAHVTTFFYNGKDLKSPGILSTQ